MKVLVLEVKDKKEEIHFRRAQGRFKLWLSLVVLL